MRPRIRLSLFVLGAAVALLLPAVAPATEEAAAREGLECAVCHDDEGGQTLTDRGMYYRLLDDLEGFEAVTERFGGCTYCHLGASGEIRMTREGQRFRWMMEDMAGLRAWLAENHPAPRPADDEPEPAPQGD